MTLALLAGLSTSTWLFLKERSAHRRALEAEQKQIRLREEADRLRQEAEYQQKLKDASVAFSRDKFEEADDLVAGIPVPEPSLEYAALFRTLGDWHAIHARWKAASDRYAVLVELNQPEDWDVTTLDYLRYGPALLELGNVKEYRPIPPCGGGTLRRNGQSASRGTHGKDQLTDACRQ